MRTVRTVHPALQSRYITPTDNGLLLLPPPWTTRQVQKAIRMARAGTGTLESPALSNSNGLPDEHPFIASAVQIQRTSHCSRHRNQETSCRSFGETAKESGKRKDQAAEQEEKKEKKNKGSMNKQNVKSNLRIDGLGNTDANL